MKSQTFSLVGFQDALVARLQKAHRKTYQATMGQARKALKKIGFTAMQASAIVRDAHDMAILAEESL